MQALILAGGSGTRFWPVSRKKTPKQLLAFGETESLLQATVSRLQPLVGPESVWVCTTAALAAEVRAQLPEVPANQILEEPVGRNTALAIGWSVTCLLKELDNEVIVVLPADHHVEDVEKFQATLEVAAAAAADQDSILTLGVRPTRAEIGYGYLELGETLDDTGKIRRVLRFTEKPDLESAREFVSSGKFLWNAGIFVFRGRVLLDRLRQHQPELAEGLAEIETSPNRLVEIYSDLPAISIDHGLMEKLGDLGTVPLDCGWTDLGSWEAMWEQLGPDSDGNVVSGEVISIDSKNNLLMSTDGVVAAVGVEGLVIVKTRDAVLVIPKERSQEVRQIVEQLAATSRDDLL